MSLRIGNPITFILKLLNLTNHYSIADGLLNENVDDKQIPKSCLVIKGFEEQTSDILKDSHVCFKEGLHFVLALIAYNEWKINSIDIKTAFLQGEETDRELFILPTKEANTSNVWCSKKRPYGLVDVSKMI